MKIIQNSSITDISASSENPNYPAVNLLDEHPKRKWMASDSSVSSAVLDIRVTGTTGGMGIVGIVADNVIVEVSDPSGIDWQNVNWQNVNWVSTPDNLAISTELSKYGEYATLWVEFTQFEATVNITVSLYKNADNSQVLSAGVVIAGQFDNIPGLEYGLQESLIDYSIQRPLSNGARFYKRRDIVRKFVGHLMLNRCKFFWQFMRGIVRTNGQRPMMFHLCDVVGEWTVYGRISTMPSGQHTYFDYSEIDFEITEVL